MADISNVTLLDGNTYNLKDSVARNSIPTKTSQLTNDSNYIARSEGYETLLTTLETPKITFIINVSNQTASIIDLPNNQIVSFGTAVGLGYNTVNDTIFAQIINGTGMSNATARIYEPIKIDIENQSIILQCVENNTIHTVNVTDSGNGLIGTYSTSTNVSTPVIGNSSDITPAQVKTALQAGNDICITHYGELGEEIALELKFTSWNSAMDTNHSGEAVDAVISQTIALYNGLYCLFELIGFVSSGNWELFTTVLAKKSEIPTSTSDLTNDSDFVSDFSYVHTDNNFTDALKTKLNGIAEGATVDDHKWNDVSLSKTHSATSANEVYIPYLSSTTSTSSKLMRGSVNPASWALAKFDDSAYLNSTTPTAGDSSKKVATTAFVSDAIGTAISGVNSFEYEVVQELPTSNIKDHTIYLVPKAGGTGDVYDEYLYINNLWEHIGSTDVDLSGYVPTERKINGKSLSSDITLSASDVNALPSSTSIPSATSDLTNDSGFITKATATEEAEKTIPFIPYGQLDSTSTATVMTATVPGISELKDGTTVMLKNGVITSASGFTLNINGLGAKPVYSNMAAASRETTIFNVAYTMLFMYDEDRVSGGCWICYRGYDANTTMTYGHLSYYYRPYAGQNLYRYKFVLQGADNRVYPIVTTNQTDSTQVDKTPTTVGLKPHNIWWYNTTGTVNAGAAVPANSLMEAGYGTACVYNFNTSTGAYKNIYLRGTYDADKDLFYLYDDGGTPCKSYYAFVPNNTANINLSTYLVAGYYYLHLGASYSTTNYFNLLAYNQFYYFDGTSLIPVPTKVAKDIEAEIPTKTSELTNDSGFLTSAPVSSVNNKTGAVSLTYSDVGAAASSHEHAASDITSGTLSAERGGTGKTSISAAANAFMVSLNTQSATSDVADTTLIATSANTGETNTWYRRPATKLWNYIKGKSDALYAAKSHTHSDYVPTTRTVNGKALSANISLSAGDVGAAKAESVVSSTLAVASWSNGVYSFTSTYPNASYDIAVEPDGNSITAEQYEAWINAKIVGNSASNTIKALGIVPTVAIPVVIRVMPK